MPKTRPPYPPGFRRQMFELVRAGRTPEDPRDKSGGVSREIGVSRLVLHHTPRPRSDSQRRVPPRIRWSTRVTPTELHASHKAEDRGKDCASPESCGPLVGWGDQGGSL